FQVREDFLKKSSRFAQLLLRNIDGDVNGGALERFDENASLRTGAGAKSDQLDACSEVRRDLGAISIQNVDLSSGNVIFRQLANFLEQHRAALIVKILAAKCSRIAGKSGDYVCRKVRTGGRQLRNRWYGRSSFGSHYGIIVWRAPDGRCLTDSLRIACESDAGELPALFRLKEIAIRAANMSTRRRAGTAAQDVLVAHEFAVIFAERARCGVIAGIRRVGAARPFPYVAEHLVK